MKTILIAEDYTGQHSRLIKAVSEFDYQCKICKNSPIELSIILADLVPDLIILNVSRIGLDDLREIVMAANVKGVKYPIINIGTYEDPWLEPGINLKEIKGSFHHPYDIPTVVKSINRLLFNEQDESTRGEMLNNKLYSLILKLNPSKKQRGNTYICDSVAALLSDHSGKVRLHGYLYDYIAKKYDTTVKSVEHSIRISVNSCWNTTNTELLSLCMKDLYLRGKRPTNLEFINALVQCFSGDTTAIFKNSPSHKLHI
ncbi:sporulation initiation factor Spo0A C-terminal domain-containing protein [Ruminococcus sp. FC2018]|uniref:sporulation initiation factor Spo0A C-terminal domain-containing protein n=1 Tax=Ruminococcus sp. FC2018 TaxID=1410617 RepID=UPI000686D02B|nr:sporulation initiation factor Spo0A C-terminal domain-containing protein [Ruminococcus sp. FC2018]